jgi:hypothetical protein
MKMRIVSGFLFSVITISMMILSVKSVCGHTVWTQRNSPGPWTVVLYHCDDEDVNEGSVIQEAGGKPNLNLLIGPPEGEGLESTNQVPQAILSRAIIGNSTQYCVASGTTAHPAGDMSIEFWCRFLEIGADIQLGFMDGVSLRLRISPDGDRFQLMGLNVQDVDDTRYAAPGFASFPPVGTWHHYGVTIHAPNVIQLENGNYQYGEGCFAKFYYDSHIVGFVDQRQTDLTGLEFAPAAAPAILIHQGRAVFDEFMISSVDWSDPVGHGGSGHGGIGQDHAFENGRQPVVVTDWHFY